jgi:hypothetical protein
VTFYARRGPNDIAFLESQKRVALEVGTGCTVFVENTAGFEDHHVRAGRANRMWRLVFGRVLTAPCTPLLRWQVWNLWRDNLYFRNFVCISSARVGKPVKLAPVRHLCRRARSVHATDPLARSHIGYRSRPGRALRLSSPGTSSCLALCQRSKTAAPPRQGPIVDNRPLRACLPGLNDKSHQTTEPIRSSEARCPRSVCIRYTSSG